MGSVKPPARPERAGQSPYPRQRPQPAPPGAKRVRRSERSERLEHASQRPQRSAEVGLAITPWERQNAHPYLAHGVAAQLVLAILAHQDEINAYPKGAVELHWGPNGVQGRFHPLWEPTLPATISAYFAPSPFPAGPRTPGRTAVVHTLGVQDLEIHGDERTPWDVSPFSDSSPTETP